MSSQLHRVSRALGLCLVLGAGLLSAIAAEPVTPLPCVHAGNCVDSLGRDALPALSYAGSPEQGRALLLSTLAAFPQARVESGQGNPVQAIFTTTLGFRDQVEFWIDSRGARIDFRSRSLLGLYDFGKNRSRMLEVSARFAQEAAGSAPLNRSTP